MSPNNDMRTPVPPRALSPSIQPALTPPPRAALASPTPQRRALATAPTPPRRPVTHDSFSASNSASSSRSSSGSRRPIIPSQQPGASALSSTSAFTRRAKQAISSAAAYAATTAGTVAAATGSERGAAWEEWARDWRDGRSSSIKGKEIINVLPGWAVKRPQKGATDGAFDLHISSVGFATFVRDPGSASRTQRALMGIAKRFAALPSLPTEDQMASVLKETLSETPQDEIRESDFEAAMAKAADKPQRDNVPKSSTSTSTRPTPSRSNTTEMAFADPDQLSLAHEYLDLRLRPFWSNVLPYRRVALAIYTIPLKPNEEPPTPGVEIWKQEPLMRTTFTTNSQGHFAQNFVIPWERICTHPPSVGMAFADDPAKDRTDWGLVVRAVLLSEEGPNRLRPATGSTDAFETTGDGIAIPRRVAGANSFFSSNEIPGRNDGDGDEEMGLMGLGRSSVQSTAIIRVSRPGGVRVISDLDDTVKHSDILSGPREVFRNVFCRRLEDICVNGMAELYTELNHCGLSGLSYVSNSPFELFPVVSDFFKLHRFPSYYSLKLKFYGGRSIITSLFEPAGERKRPSIIEILDEFYDSKFILIGDSGEQDLELYSAIAHERPKQIAAVFIRDVTSGRADALRQIEAGLYTASLDESGRSSGRSSPTPPSGATTPGSERSSSGPSADELKRTVAELQDLSANEQKLLKRAAQWESRVALAYETTPPHIPLIFFKEPEEIRSLACGIVKEANVAGSEDKPIK